MDRETKHEQLEKARAVEGRCAKFKEQLSVVERDAARAAKREALSIEYEEIFGEEMPDWNHLAVSHDDDFEW